MFLICWLFFCDAVPTQAQRRPARAVAAWLPRSLRSPETTCQQGSSSSLQLPQSRVAQGGPREKTSTAILASWVALGFASGQGKIVYSKMSSRADRSTLRSRTFSAQLCFWILSILLHQLILRKLFTIFEMLFELNVFRQIIIKSLVS